MIRVGVCMAGLWEPHGWLQPQPTIASWLALRKLGVTDVRLQFDVSAASSEFGKWNGSLFTAFVMPAWQAGVRINANYCISVERSHFDASFHEIAAQSLVDGWGPYIDSYSFGNEPGAAAKAYDEVEVPPPEGGGEFTHRDYMRDVYFPRYVIPFTKGVRRAKPGAWIGGCDADSADIQQRYIALADEHARLEAPCFEEWIHPYGDVGGGDYATLARFKEAREASKFVRRQWGISEIDHQQLPSAIKRRADVTAEWLAKGATQRDAEEQGALARTRATVDEIETLIAYFTTVARDYPDCTRFNLNFADYFFERGVRPDNGLPCNSFFLAEPKVSTVGRKFADAIAKVNGPVQVSGGQQGRQAGRRTS